MHPNRPSLILPPYHAISPQGTRPGLNETGTIQPDDNNEGSADLRGSFYSAVSPETGPGDSPDGEYPFCTVNPPVTSRADYSGELPIHHA